MATDAEKVKAWAPIVKAAGELVDAGTISSSSGPAAPVFDKFDAETERNRGRWYAVDAEPLDALSAAVRELRDR